MKILHIYQGDNGRLTIVRVSRSEALTIMQSLAAQMLADSPNVGRQEFFDDNTGEYFTIALGEASK